MEHLGLFMEIQTNAVSTKLSHHREPIALSELLNRKANVTQVNPRFDLHNTMPHGLIGQLTKSFGHNGGLSEQKHATRVSVPAVLDDRDVDVDNVTLFQGLVIGNAVTDLVVDGGANGLWVRRVAPGCIVQWRGDGPLDLRDVVVRQLVELVGRDTWHHVGRQIVQDFGGESTSNSHALNAVLIFECNSHGSIISGLKALFGSRQ